MHKPKITAEAFATALPGLQLAAFELLWPAEPKLELVCARVDDGAVEIRCTPKLASEDEDACRRILEEIFNEAFGAVHTAISFDAPERGHKWHTVISPEVFKAIAAEVAPWRLDAGR